MIHAIESDPTIRNEAGHGADASTSNFCSTRNGSVGSINLTSTFVESVIRRNKVDECPHAFYKYPARFPPGFARQAIEDFSGRDDLVIDCFSGGGTTLVEAIALGRRAVGYDISSLACFMASVKTTPLSIHDERQLKAWGARVRWQPKFDVGVERHQSDADYNYYRRNLPPHIAAAFALLLAEISTLPGSRQQRFARFVLLAVGQATLDCKTKLPTMRAIHLAFCEKLLSYLETFRQYTWESSRQFRTGHLSRAHDCRIINSSSENAASDPRFPHSWGKAKLVVTSPPYPGVHMLYHRWQLLGRKETPVPFLLADCRDGSGTSYYCLGGRHQKGLSTYFSRIERIFRSLKGLIQPEATVVQMVAFNNPELQLPAYLAAMTNAGYTEVAARPTSEYIVGGRLWRPVPGRKWYAAMRPAIPAAKEVVLIHKPTPSII